MSIDRRKKTRWCAMCGRPAGEVGAVSERDAERDLIVRYLRGKAAALREQYPDGMLAHTAHVTAHSLGLFADDIEAGNHEAWVKTWGEKP